ncbi:MAG: type II toxin-antitoxin system RelE/ParE family toxin [Methanosarcinales archaeon]|nr:type II toxin-antitoxin system RelE/ParE family toxin [Methanosarcinales archaeon]
MAYKVEYKSSVSRDLKRLDKRVAKRILQQLEREIGDDPNCGIPLTGQFKGLFKYRIGDYRVIYTRIKEKVLVLRIGHRSKVYK